MDHRSTLIRNVEIPSTLPPMDTLTKLNGSILLKEVTSEENDIRIEGDLLWRGYFEEGGGECLWEGAEYFTETIPNSALRQADPPLIEPKILSLEGEALSENTFRLTFDIRWFEDEEKEAAEPKKEKEAIIDIKPTEKREEPQEPPKEEKTACPCHKPQEACGSKEKHVEQHRETPTERDGEKKIADDFTEKLEAIDDTWRETLKNINEPTTEAENPSTTAEETVAREEETEEVEIKCCPYSKFCLRYYSTQEGDELEQIAEKFSATVAKLKEFNRIDESTLSSGRLLRIP